MEYKEAIKILMNILNNYSLNKEEKEAILMAIGTLDCGSLAENRTNKIIQSKKEKLKRNFD
ncbi:MAG TPA: hypothetical protein PKI00_01575 [Candidatus Pacearchaeota archaeon]|nr:hypothetical protein [Candidatus Parcubacteria bacterium]HNP79522.1 hypothetical protein [Candidatus Pacearchaeota archaeon]